MKIHNAFRLGLFGGFGVLVALLVGSSISNLATILAYVGIAFFLALGLDPLVSWLERRKLPRWLAILTVLIGILALFAGMVLAIVPVIVDQVGMLIERLPFVITIFTDGTVRSWLEENVPWLEIDEMIAAGLAFISDPNNITEITGGVFATAFGVANGLFGVLIVLILTLYFVSSLSHIKRSLYKLVPASTRERFVDLAEQIADSVGRYVIGQLGLALINGTLSFIFLTFVIRAEYSALLAFISFLLSLVPLIGSVIASVLISVLVLLFNGWQSAIGVAVYYLIYMQIEAYVLTPAVMNRTVRVPGVVVVIGALAGGTLLGVVGALVAIPVAAAAMMIIKQVLIPRQNTI